jgi:UDP-D-galactose:(glucosyl)LPS alpha-1,6-D-galactosyltransferase
MIIDIVLGYAVGKGGLENVIKLVTDELEKRGHLVRIFQIAPPKYLDWAEQFSNIYYFGDEAGVYSPLDQSTGDLFSSNYERLTQMFGRPDVILATHTPVMSWLCRMAVNKMNPVKRPTILSWLHGPPNIFGGESYLNLCDGHLAISKSIAKQIGKHVSSKHVYYIGNTIDFENSYLVNRPSEKLKMIYVGRIANNQKRVDVLLKALKHLNGSWKLDIIGDGPDQPKLQDLSRSLNLESNIEWHGWKSDPWKTMSSASVLILSSDFEGFALILIEALSRGVPVISSLWDGANEIVRDDVNGWLFPCGDDSKLHEIIQNILDGEKVLPEPEQCRKSVSEYKTDKIVNRIENAINKVMNE